MLSLVIAIVCGILEMLAVTLFSYQTAFVLLFGRSDTQIYNDYVSVIITTLLAVIIL